MRNRGAHFKINHTARVLVVLTGRGVAGLDCRAPHAHTLLEKIDAEEMEADEGVRLSQAECQCVVVCTLSHYYAIPRSR